MAATKPVIKGRGVVVHVNMGTEQVPNWQPVCGQQGGSLEREIDTVDISTKDSEFNEYELSQMTWSVSIDGLLKLTDDAFKYLEQAFMNKEKVFVQFEANEQIYSGECRITSLPLEFGYEDMVTYTCELQGTGTLEITPK